MRLAGWGGGADLHSIFPVGAALTGKVVDNGSKSTLLHSVSSRSKGQVPNRTPLLSIGPPMKPVVLHTSTVLALKVSLATTTVGSHTAMETREVERWRQDLEGNSGLGESRRFWKKVGGPRSNSECVTGELGA